jgi:hypothetical protein
MKKILVAIMAVLFAAPSFAQSSSGGFSLNESSIYYGARLGMNISTLTGDVDDLNAKVGLNLGGVIGLRLSEATPVFLESGLYFTMNGAKKDKNEVNLNYLEIPILIKYGIQATDDIHILPYIGPTFGYGLGGKWKGDGSSESSFGSNKFSRPDVGIKLGCGFDYNMLYLEAGYKFGITNIADWKDANNNDASVHNGAVFINVGVNF